MDFLSGEISQQMSESGLKISYSNLGSRGSAWLYLGSILVNKWNVSTFPRLTFILIMIIILNLPRVILNSENWVRCNWASSLLIKRIDLVSGCNLNPKYLLSYYSIIEGFDRDKDNHDQRFPSWRFPPMRMFDTWQPSNQML